MGCKHLSNCRRLRELRLSFTAVSDEGVKLLSKLSELSYLELAETRVTDDGLKEFQKVLPECEVYWY